MLFEQVCKQLNLLETDYFGLEYTDNRGSTYWLDRDKPMNQQVPLPVPVPVQVSVPINLHVTVPVSIPVTVPVTLHVSVPVTLKLLSISYKWLICKNDQGTVTGSGPEL